MQTKVGGRSRKKKPARHGRPERPLTSADIKRVITSGRQVYGSQKNPRVVKSPWADELVVFVSSPKEGRQLPEKVTVEGKQYSLNVQKKAERATILAALQKLHDLGQTRPVRDEVPAKPLSPSPFAEERRLARRAQMKRKGSSTQIKARDNFLAALNAASI